MKEPTSQSCDQQPCLLITGGCGFIGVNLLDFMLKKGLTNSRILDNLSVGQIQDLESVLSEHDKYEKKEENNKIIYTFSSLLTFPSSLTQPQVELLIGDIRNPEDCNQATEGVESVVHLAAQSGVPTSVENPMIRLRDKCHGYTKHA
jgi:nucleoside-diphosphate-sugar epimerase